LRKEDAQKGLAHKITPSRTLMKKPKTVSRDVTPIFDLYIVTMEKKDIQSDHSDWMTRWPDKF